MTTYRITEWDQTKPQYGVGAFIFELNGGQCYVIRKRNGHCIHLDRAFQPVSFCTYQLSDKANRENAVRAYHIANRRHFTLTGTVEEWCAMARKADEEFDITPGSPNHHYSHCPDCKGQNND